MKPSYKIKIKGKTFPVFRSPVTDKQIQELMMSGKTDIFYIHDNKSGKIKKYDFRHKLPSKHMIDLSIGYNTILKMGFSALMGYYLYKMATYKPLKGWKQKNDDWLKRQNDKFKASRVVKSPADSTASVPQANVKESSNGWIIEEIN